MKRLALALAVVVGVILIVAPNVSAAKPSGATGTLTADGSTITATYDGVKKNQTVRVQALCQTPDTSVVWGDYIDLTTSPTTHTFDIPGGLACRADLYLIAKGSLRVTHLVNNVALG